MLLGIRTADELAKYLTPRRPEYVLSEVRNAADTCPLDPVARTRNGDAVDCDLQAAGAQVAVHSARSAADGAKRASNCPLASQCW